MYLDSKLYRRIYENKDFVSFASNLGSRRSNFNWIWSIKIRWFLYYSFHPYRSESRREGSIIEMTDWCRKDVFKNEWSILSRIDERLDNIRTYRDTKRQKDSVYNCWLIYRWISMMSKYHTKEWDYPYWRLKRMSDQEIREASKRDWRS